MTMLRACLVAAMVACAQSTVVSIDFGTEFIKVALIKPGSKIDIVLNERSSRKWPALVGFSRGERAFAESAAIWGTRYPDTVYGTMKQLLGQSYDKGVLSRFEVMHMPYKLVPVEQRGVVGIQNADGNVTLPEELIAQVLEYSRAAAAEHGGVPDVKDCVITVPTFFTASMRTAVLDAADLAGFNVLSLLNDGTAVAIQYGMDKNYDVAPFNGTEAAPYRVLVYDMGYSFTQLSLVSYYKVSVKDGSRKNKTVGMIQVVASAWDATLGGSNFDAVLISYFADFIDEKGPATLKAKGGVRLDPRAMAKIRKEANRVKKVLSANTETFATIEGVVDDYDFKMPVNRAKFEELCDELFTRAVKPVKGLLEDAGLVASDINAVEIFGGPVRIPKVQTQLAAEFDRQEVDKHINGDEGAVTGASFFAANLSTAFRVRQLFVSDQCAYSISVAVTTLQPTEEEEAEMAPVTGADADADAVDGVNPLVASNEKLAAANISDVNMTVKLFPKGSRLDTRKKVSFATGKDYTVTVKYSDPEQLPAGADPLIVAFNVTGIRRMASPYNHSGKVKASMSFQLTRSSLVELVKYDLIVEETVLETVKVKRNKTKEPAAKENATAAGEGDEAEGKENVTAAAADGEEEKKPDAAADSDSPADSSASSDAPADSSDGEKKDDAADGEKAEEGAAADSAPSDSESKKEGGEAEEEKKAEGEESGEEKKTTPTSTEDSDENKTETDGADEKGDETIKEKIKKRKAEPPKVEEPTFDLVERPKKRVQKVPLTIVYDNADRTIKPLGGDLLDGAKSALATYRAAAELKRQKDEAKNTLEALLYSVSTKFEDEEAILKFASPDDLEVLRTNTTEIKEWLEYDASDDMDLEEFTGRLGGIREIVDPMTSRFEQSLALPKALKSAEEVATVTRNLLANWTAAMPNASVLTDNETAAVEARVASMEEWVANKTAKQSKLELYDEPVFVGSQVQRKVDGIIEDVQRLSRRRPKPKPKAKVVKNATNDSNDTNASADSATINVTGSDFHTDAPELDAELPGDAEEGSSSSGEEKKEGEEAPAADGEAAAEDGAGSSSEEKEGSADNAADEL